MRPSCDSPRPRRTGRSMRASGRARCTCAASAWRQPAMAASTSPLSISVRGDRWVGAQRSSRCPSRSGKCRRRLPAHLQLARRHLNRIFLALGDDANEVADPHHRHKSGNIADRCLVDRDQAGADERSLHRRRRRAGARRGHAACRARAHRERKVSSPVAFAGRSDARHRLADDGVGADGFDGDVVCRAPGGRSRCR